jgi:hypothetical protein
LAYNMARPALLVVDPDSSRRRELARGLSGFGYEVVPAVDAAEGRRFAAGLGPAVVVAPMDLPGMNGDAPGTGWNALAGAERTLLLLGESEEEAGILPREILFLAARGLAGDDLARRVRLVLLGREIGVEPDADLKSLVGDLALFPFLELLRALHRAQVSGLVVLDGGEVHLEGGEVAAARVTTATTAAGVRGEKAFCRLARREAGPFHLLPAGPGVTREGRGEIGKDLTSLLILAIEDHVHGAPGPELRVRLSTSPAYFATPFTLSERRLLGALADDPTVGHLLDTLPGTDGEVLRDLLAFRERGLVVFEEPRLPAAVVTDSASDLTPELARANGIEVAPIQVLFGEGFGLLALFADRLARRGVPASEIAGRLADMRGRLHVLFVVDTLDDLPRGGRIGRARAAFGNLLGVKPILGVVAGEVVVVDRVRGGRLAPPRLLELFRERVAQDRPVIARVAHAKAPVWADRLRDLLAGAFDVRELLVTEIEPVVGTHAGPGTVGAVVFQPTAEELPLLAPLEE